jgi:uncharacterized membrane protein YdjX (TVP38/TMEM64 family)
MQKKSVGFFVFLIFIALCAGLIWYFNLLQYFSLSAIQSRLASLRAALQDCYLCVLGIYVGIFTLISACMLPAVGPMTLIGGYLFGAYVGFCAAMGSLLGGIGISFTIIRYLSDAWLPKKWHARREKFVARVREHGAWYIFILNVVTVVPFVVITTLAALSEISVWKFIGASLLGSAPMILMYAFAGRQLADISSFGELFSPWFIGILLLLGSLSFVPLLVKRFTKLSIDDV